MIGKSKFTLRCAVANKFFVGDLVRARATGRLGEVIGMELVGNHYYNVSFNTSVEGEVPIVRYVGSDTIELVKMVEDRFLELDEDAIEVLNRLREVMYHRLGDEGYSVLLSEKTLFEEVLKVLEDGQV